MNRTPVQALAPSRLVPRIGALPLGSGCPERATIRAFPSLSTHFGPVIYRQGFVPLHAKGATAAPRLRLPPFTGVDPPSRPLGAFLAGGCGTGRTGTRLKPHQVVVTTVNGGHGVTRAPPPPARSRGLYSGLSGHRQAPVNGGARQSNHSSFGNVPASRRERGFPTGRPDELEVRPWPGAFPAGATDWRPSLPFGRGAYPCDHHNAASLRTVVPTLRAVSGSPMIQAKRRPNGLSVLRTSPLA
jgi:hypothetical protein